MVWENDSQKPGASSPPILVLKDILDASLAELSISLEKESLRSLPENLRGKCCAPLRELDETRLTELLAQAARVRFENKGLLFRARAKIVGWEQTLWENLFRALGYKHNVWPMHNLAETKPQFSRGAATAFELQSTFAWHRRVVARPTHPFPKESRQVICAGHGIFGGANVTAFPNSFCPAPPGNSTAFVPPTTRNGASPWPPIGSGAKKLSDRKRSSIGSRRMFRTKN